MAPTPSPRPAPTHHHQTPVKTPQSKHRLHLPNPKSGAAPSPSPFSAAREAVPTEHPVEVISRIRDYPDRKEKPASALDTAQDGRSVHVRTDIGYRDFSLDGVSVAGDEDLEGFYRRFVRSRIEGVRLGAKCTIMMYGPTGSGKSHTMFGCSKQPGIVYRALRDILGGEVDGEDGEDDAGFGLRPFVQVAVLEIYNEEIYDLLSGNLNGGGASVGISKANVPKARLEVMGKKAKNATYISGNEAGKISREVAKVEKRRIVKATLCNERSSRSHCLIVLDVPSVGGRLMLVDMAGSENIEAAGQAGFEAKMQTAKINQGNIALKRVVESIANGDSHVPFRDSKLTMLLQDSFEDDGSKILMILCVSPDPKELHKTISTLEYGAKAKCIVRAAHMPTPRDKMNSEESSVHLNSRITAMNQFIYKLQMENKVKEKERDKAHKELLQKEEELTLLRSKLVLMEGKGAAAIEEEINSKVMERTQVLRIELVKMEEKMQQQQQELSLLKQRLQEVEIERVSGGGEGALHGLGGGRLMMRLSELCAGEEGMVKSMELDMGDQLAIQDVKEIKEDTHQSDSFWKHLALNPDKVVLSTVFEGEEGEDRDSAQEDEIYKEVVEENLETGVKNRSSALDAIEDQLGLGTLKESDSARKARIQNIFRLCGNYRELSKQAKVQTPPKQRYGDENMDPSSLSMLMAVDKQSGPEVGLQAEHVEPWPQICSASDVKANRNPISLPLEPLTSLRHSNFSVEKSDDCEENSISGVVDAEGWLGVYVKWEASKESPGNLIKKLKLLNNSSLSDLRKLIEAHLEETKSNQSFVFLLLGDPSGAPVSKEKEATTQVSKLPICNNQQNGHLACLRLLKKATDRAAHAPLSTLENTFPIAPGILSSAV